MSVDEQILETETTEGSMLVFSMKKFVLEELLVKAASVVPTRDVLPVLKNFQIAVDEEGIRVAATDMNLSVVAKTALVTVDGKGTAVFPARRMLEIVREASEGEIEAQVTERQANIRVGRTEWSLRLEDGEEYPDLPDEDDIEFTKVNRAKFVSAINQVRNAAARDSVRANLMMIDVSDGRMRASDGVRFQQVAVEKGFPEVQIPIYAVDDLLKILRTTEEEHIEIGEDETSLVFRIADDVFVAQLLNAEFPDIDRDLLKPALANKITLSVDRSELASAIKRVRITADEETSAVILKLAKGEVTVTSKDKVGSWTRESLDAVYDGDERAVAVNHNHLTDMLSSADAPSCQFYLGTDEKTRPSPLMLRDESSGFIAIISQLRVAHVS